MLEYFCSTGHKPEIDQHFQATIHFPLTIVIEQPQQPQSIFRLKKFRVCWESNPQPSDLCLRFWPLYQSHIMISHYSGHSFISCLSTGLNLKFLKGLFCHLNSRWRSQSRLRHLPAPHQRRRVQHLDGLLPQDVLRHQRIPGLELQRFQVSPCVLLWAVTCIIILLSTL